MIRVLTQYPIMFFFDDQVYSMFSVHCPLLKQFKMVSCRADQPLPNRVLSQLTCTGRDSSSPHYMPPRLNFNSYDLWLPAFVCKCAEKAQARGHRYFGIEFWGKWCKLHCGSFWSSAAYRWVYTRGGVYLEGAYKTACKGFVVYSLKSTSEKLIQKFTESKDCSASCTLFLFYKNSEFFAEAEYF